MDLPVVEGEIFAGKYRIERLLGKGGMGVVLAATHLQLAQRVALKLLCGDVTKEAVERFLREARAAARLKSEHVTRVIDVGESQDGVPYMVLEYLEGHDLAAVLDQRGPLPHGEAIEYVLQACEAIAEAHRVGIIHRDLKPSNLFLTVATDDSKTVKVLDFGISKELAPMSPEAAPEGAPPPLVLTKTSQVLGSPLFMAPEQLRSARTVDARADIWALGVTLYHLVTRRFPFEAGSLHELLVMLASDDVPMPPRFYRPELPALIEVAILRCLAKDLEQRFAHVGAFAAALAPYGPEEARRSVVRIHRTLGIEVPHISPAEEAYATGAPSHDESLAPTERVPLQRNELTTTDALPETNALAETVERAELSTPSAELSPPSAELSPQVEAPKPAATPAPDEKAARTHHAPMRTMTLAALGLAGLAALALRPSGERSDGVAPSSAVAPVATPASANAEAPTVPSFVQPMAAAPATTARERAPATLPAATTRATSALRQLAPQASTSFARTAATASTAPSHAASTLASPQDPFQKLNRRGLQ